MIARRLGRAPSTVSRELAPNAEGGSGYRATTAHALAFERASQPKPAKLAVIVALCDLVHDDLRRGYLPEQIAGRLRRQSPDDRQMWVSTQTIYQSLYVQSRGALRRELTRWLRTGRALRQPARHAGQRKTPIVRDMVTSAAPARGRRSRRARPWGGRPDDRQAQRLGDRHAGRAHHRLRDARCPTAIGPSASRRWRPRSTRCPRRCAAC